MKRLTRGTRKRYRELLVSAYGTNCCWCGTEMEVPKPRQPAVNMENMATIEHYFAKEAGDPDNFFFFKLAHKRCNK